MKADSNDASVRYIAMPKLSAVEVGCWKTTMDHHIRSNLCTTRPRYRQGRHLKAVKVYTVSQESAHLLIQGVPSVASPADLLKVCHKYGVVEQWGVVEDCPREEFTQVVRVKYKRISNARAAKRKLDDSSFLGGILHVSYAPEHESVQETRDKLQQRRIDVARQIRRLVKEEQAQAVPEVPHDRVETEQPETHETKRESPTEANRGITSQGGNDPMPRVGPLDQQSLASQPLPAPSTTYGPPGDYNPYGWASFPAWSSPVPHPPSYPSQIPHHFLDLRNDSTTTSQWNSAEKTHQLRAQATATQSYEETEPITGADTASSQQSGDLLIKDYSPTEKQTVKPVFIPRQSARRTFLPERLLEAVTVSVKEGAVPVDRKAEKRKRDSVNDQLRQAAFILGKKAGPKALSEVDREIFESREKAVANESVDKTVREIRRKVLQFSAKALPPQLKRRRKVDKNAAEVIKAHKENGG